MIPCLALASIMWQGDAPTVECSAAAINVAGRGIVHLPQTGINSDFVYIEQESDWGHSRKLTGTTSSGALSNGWSQQLHRNGGESTVYRIQMAEMRYRPLDSLRLSVGFVEDFWVESSNRELGVNEI